MSMNEFDETKRQPKGSVSAAVLDQSVQVLKAKDRLGLIPEQVVFVESKKDTTFYRLILDNYRAVCEKFANIGYDFIYIPKVRDEIAERDNGKKLVEALRYCFPDHTLQKIVDFNDLLCDTYSTPSKTKQLFSALRYNNEVDAGLLRLVSDEPDANGNFSFEYTQFVSPEKMAIIEQIDDFVNNHLPYRKNDDAFDDAFEEAFDLFYEEHYEEFSKITPIVSAVKEPEVAYTPEPGLGIHFQIVPYDRPVSDSDSDSDSVTAHTPPPPQPLPDALEKIKEHIEWAQELGIYEEIIDEIFNILSKIENNNTDNKLKISRLTIDSEYRIFLPDYASREIEMSVLPKTLFIFFLRHPEGVILKQLSDYEPEILHIYKALSNRMNEQEMRESIKQLCHPTDNSVNEKISRIKRAFLRQISDRNARHYYISGRRGGKYNIILNRELVSLPKELRT